MGYESETKEVILERMLSSSPATIDQREGSITYDLLSPAAIELAETYIQLELTLKHGFADTTYGEYLDKRCREMGVERHSELQSSGKVSFTSDYEIVIPKGVRVSTAVTVDSDPIYFETIEEGIIGNGNSSIDITVKAEEGGTLGNIGANQISLVYGELSGLVQVVNADSFDNGVDEESDADLLNRYLVRVQNPSTSGNVNHYLEWAKEIPGISDAVVVPIWNGNGTVKVILLSTEKSTPDQTIIDHVRQHIESVRPVGAEVTVVGAPEVEITIDASIVLDQGFELDQVKEQITEYVREYLVSLAYRDSLVRYSQIASTILDIDGVLDYVGFTMNGGTSNIHVSIEEGEVAVLGEVTISED
ncbi:baseplate J/gp47 family protein [Chengkuizengella axinellae]|uniref:Baseplate J/gp47 family protein n=1 Tax=Chengkuizengella axinellae TaxID=3064388 RepID=A0ABT9J2H5_9BACL|nr:baseplate J/gp47 family protein [Chengkuizengella sp. 2205SS18-9]MDP5275698.1 baseplate J/gp47 family protein [Chengkuizengella sp. 2205SS18-9]